jgi:hypothetical protein
MTAIDAECRQAVEINLTRRFRHAVGRRLRHADAGGQGWLLHRCDQPPERSAEEALTARWRPGLDTVRGFLKAVGKPFAPFETNRASKYLCQKGKPVFLLIPSDGKGVYVTQSFTDHIEKTSRRTNFPTLAAC